MQGVFWLVASWGAIAVFLLVTIGRIVSTARLPIHLRWELAPIPHEKGKGRYGGSYLEDYEWWKEARKRSLTAPLFFMAGEILLFKGVWRRNRSLWPFSFALHWGSYLFILAFLVELASAILFSGGPGPESSLLLAIASPLALCGDLIGTFGVIGLILKRILDSGFRWSNSLGALLNLLVLGALFVSGLFAWSLSADPAAAASLLIKAVVSLDRHFEVSAPLAAHGVVFLLCCVYLPFTNMVHFIVKYFMYHAVRWNDKPLNARMERELRCLLAGPVGWDGQHAGAQATWLDLDKEKDDAKNEKG